MAIKDANKDYWDKVSSVFHNEENTPPEIEESNEYRFAKKLSDVKKETGKIYGLGKKESAWAKIESRMATTSRIPNLIKYAAIIVLALTLGSVLTTFMSNNFGEEKLSSIEVPLGQTSKLVLFDGTEVWLNSGSTIQYPNKFNKNQRTVRLKGEAYFKVTKNKKLPFIVETNKMQVKVLGTSFNLSAYEEDKVNSLTLVEGKVDLLKPSGQWLTSVQPGEQVVFDNKKIAIKNVDTSFYSSWKDGKLVFTGATLGEIAKKLERSYNVAIEFKNKDVEDLKINGTFLKYKPIEQIFQALKILAPIDYNIKINPNSKDEIKIYAKYLNEKPM